MRSSPLSWVLVAALASFIAACGPAAVPPGGNADGGNNNDNCPMGTADCDDNPANGCEADLNTITTCGACTSSCGVLNGSPACVGGVCQLNCLPGYENCDGFTDNGCEAYLESTQTCGSCSNFCSTINATAECVGGMCVYTCSPGKGDCNEAPEDGCETTLDTAQACGACDNSCTLNCVAGNCEACDGPLALASNDAMDAAKAMGLCGTVISATYVMPDGSPAVGGANYDLGHGILAGFGPNIDPREGSRLLALSSGTARQPSDPGYQDVAGFDKGYSNNHPAGFPKESPACPGVITGQPYDGIALKLVLQVPEWANGFAFDFDFYTFEWPSYICSQYNDFFVALLEPIPTGLPDGNISFDSMGNPISVNSAFVTVCGCAGGPPCTAGGKSFTCPSGTAELQGTGFVENLFGITTDHAATSWLTTTAPVEPGSTITLTLGIYDSGDGVLDSTALIDHFRWLPVPPEVGTEPIP